MSNYNESEISGTTWTRCWRVECDNPLAGAKSIVFHEETAISNGERVMLAQAGSVVTETLTDPAEAFDIVNPQTGAVVGQGSYGQVYALLHSLYLHCAAKRDVAEAPVEPYPPVELG